ncbi:uncharacterized protein LOC129717831 [Wyeomyia smithii]|uniref:uncharacterized protein LOC129717831 n=1 Tax=Wyeomyia smithii TaxID=174621 RepID=UPI002467BDF0|nr:uncharacterized protein LOC129717831 [Wyeomyia smithii]
MSGVDVFTLKHNDKIATGNGIQLNDFCRLCLRCCGQSRMQLLKANSANFGCESVSYPDMLTYVYGLPSNLSTHLPQRICERCVKRLEVAYRICREFKEKESLLERFYFNGSVLKGLIQYQNFRTVPRSGNEEQTQQVHNIANDSNNFDPLSQEDLLKIGQSFEVRADGLFQCTICFQTLETQQDCQEHCQYCKKSNASRQAPHRRQCRKDSSDTASADTNAGEFPELEVVTIKAEPIVSEQLDEADSDRNETSDEEDAGGSTSRRRGRPLNKYAVGADGLFNCEICPKKFTKRKQYAQHMDVHDALQMGRYRCELCNKLFRRGYHLNRHMERIHLAVRGSLKGARKNRRL